MFPPRGANIIIMFPAYNSGLINAQLPIFFQSVDQTLEYLVT